MELNSEILESGLLKVDLTGRMDILGVQDIDLKFTALISSRKGSAIVDMSAVSFLASIGIRTLISSAKALGQRGGDMVILNPQPNVLEVLQVSGVATLIPVFTDLAEAVDYLQNQQGE